MQRSGDCDVKLSHPVICLSILFASAFGAEAALAGVIPYPDSGSANPVTYSFNASASGNVLAYFTGSTAAYNNQLGLLDNGALTGAGFGLDDKTSTIGQVFDLGTVVAGDSLVFVLHNLTLGMNAYSDPAMNVSYDLNSSGIHNHIYSTAYDGASSALPGVPAGTYVAFEDLQFPQSDFNYFDETFVFTIHSDPSIPVGVPEPSSFALFGGALLLGGIAFRRSRSA